MPRKMEIEALRLKALREEKHSQFEAFMRKPEFRAVMDKLIGFLTDECSTSVRLHLTLDSHSYTDGQTITLGLLDNFFHEQYTEVDWVAAFKVLLAHEVQHINSSNFKDIQAIREFYVKVMEPYGISAECAGKVASNYLNIMEDSRIENIYIQKLPGFRLPTLMVNSEIRRMTEVDQVADTPYGEFVDFTNNALSYAITGRLAPNIEVYRGTRFAKEFHAVKHFFDEAVEARSSAACRKLCEAMLEQCAPYFAEMLKDKESQESVAQSAAAADDEYTSNQEREFNQPSQGSGNGQKRNGAASKEKSEENGSQTGEGEDQATGEGEDQATGKGGNKNKEGEGNSANEGDGQNKEGGDGSAHSTALRRPDKNDLLDPNEDFTDDFSEEVPNEVEIVSPEELAQMRRGIRDDLAHAIPEEKPKGKHEGVEDIEAMYAGEHAREFTETFPRLPSTPLPADLNATATRLERAIERILRQKRVEQRNMRTGTLDRRNLYRRGMNSPHLFMRKGRPMKADLAVFLLLDNSGSMCACGASMDGENYSKSSLSRIAAAIIEAALCKFAAIKVSLFNVSRVIHHQTLRKFDENGPGTRVYNSINTVDVGGGNKDGFSIRVATKELAARPESQKVLVILSDGLPSDYNGGEQAGIQDVRDAVKEARRKGILVVPIMFGDARFREAKRDAFGEMYDRFISCDPIDVANEFQKLFISMVKKS